MGKKVEIKTTSNFQIHYTKVKNLNSNFDIFNLEFTFRISCKFKHSDSYWHPNVVKLTISSHAIKHNPVKTKNIPSDKGQLTRRTKCTVKQNFFNVLNPANLALLMKIYP